jgi:hypothetical protein
MINVRESVDSITEAGKFAAVWGLGGTMLIDETGEYGPGWRGPADRARGHVPGADRHSPAAFPACRS